MTQASERTSFSFIQQIQVECLLMCSLLNWWHNSENDVCHVGRCIDDEISAVTEAGPLPGVVREKRQCFKLSLQQWIVGEWFFSWRRYWWWGTTGDRWRRDRIPDSFSSCLSCPPSQFLLRVLFFLLINVDDPLASDLNSFFSCHSAFSSSVTHGCHYYSL